RRTAELALNESRERLELTTRVNQIGIWEYNLDTDRLYWNDTMFELYSRSKDSFTADLNAWTQCLHPEDLEKTQKLLRESIENFLPFIAKFRIIQPDGSIRYIHAKAKIERRPNGQGQVLGTNIDITREELVLAKLHNLEVLRSAIVEFSEDAIISTTPQGIITSWNTGAYNMFGYSAETVTGKSIVNVLFTPEYSATEEVLLEKVRNGDVVKHFETVCQCADGKLVNVSITLSPIKDITGNVIGISAIKRDITETLEAARALSERQRELEKSNSELARSNKELEAFAYVASHDLKSPLRGIAQLSAWVEEDIQAGEYNSVSGHTNMMRNRIHRMEKLLDDLLIFYRAGKVEGELVKINTAEMGKELFDIQNTKTGLHLELGAELPTFSTLTVPFEQVIRNFFSNAIKHHDRNEGIIKLDCENINYEFYKFSVCDDGPGIPEKFQERIFGMFQTLKPRDELEGSGMGLALIRKIVENYGGQVTIHSQGRGCCFYFTWPKHIRTGEQS
ncbi:MAG: PAS domain S-box protein, partial [Sphingobacteriales bacterium]